jgi:quercetin dioxygenase-like cupin family protein
MYTLVNDLGTEIAVPEKGILSHTIHNDDSVKVILFGFAPGQELTAHTAPMPATIQILEGEAMLTLGPDTMEVKPGAFIHMAPQLTHGIVAKTPLRMLLTLLKAARQ